MKPFFVCNKCYFVFDNNVGSHDREHAVMANNYVTCEGTLKPVFYAEDLEKELERRIQELKKLPERKEPTKIHAEYYMQMLGLEDLKNTINSYNNNERKL